MGKKSLVFPGPPFILSWPSCEEDRHYSHWTGEETQEHGGRVNCSVIHPRVAETDFTPTGPTSQ